MEMRVLVVNLIASGPERESVHTQVRVAVNRVEVNPPHN